MSKKKIPAIPNVTSPTVISPSGTAALPIGDPFERMLTTPKESLIQRAASPRRNAPSPLKSRAATEVCLEQLPKISGT